MEQMNTFTGRRFDPINITVENICLEDIAHSLSLLCRGGGHLKWFYSVAQHSLNCAQEAKARGLSERVIKACLIHDVSEAYASDIIRPVKVHLPQYLEIEESIMNVIYEKFGLMDLTEEEHQSWKQIDDEILDHELIALLTGQEHRESVELKASPDFEQHDCKEMESRFLSELKRLFPLLSFE